MKSGNTDGAKGWRRVNCVKEICSCSRQGLNMETEFTRIMQRAMQHPNEKFNSLLGKVYSYEGLQGSFRKQSRKKAPGIDGIRKNDYEVEVEKRLTELSAKIRRMAYRPQSVRRTYIPKTNGGERPLGIPSFEDRLVQDRAAQVLSAIWEPEFRNSSYGYRPKRGAHDALKAVHDAIMQEGTRYIYEADIKGFFDNVSHEHLMKFLEHRISDPNFLRLIRRFLKAGVMEDGAFTASIEGTPQGGLVSPVLSNIYLHYVLDLWVEKKFARKSKGKVRLIRFADDFIVCFTHQEDAEQFAEEVKERLAAFELEIEPSKTKLIPFGRWMKPGEAETFTFLGFTHFLTHSRKGTVKLGRKTAGKKFRLKLQAASQKLRELRTKGTKVMVAYVAAHLRGHINYYGVSENSESLSSYCHQVERLLFKWLNRRSNKRSCKWNTFSSWYRQLKLPKPRIVHSFYSVL